MHVVGVMYDSKGFEIAWLPPPPPECWGGGGCKVIQVCDVSVMLYMTCHIHVQCKKNYASTLKGARGILILGCPSIRLSVSTPQILLM